MGLFTRLLAFLQNSNGKPHSSSSNPSFAKAVTAPTPLASIRAEGLVAIGNAEPVCPYCASQFKRMPARKTRCPTCQNDVYSRTRPFDQRKVLLRTEDLERLQEQWAIAQGTGQSYLEHRQHNESLTESLAKRFGQPVQFDERHVISDSPAEADLQPGFPRYSIGDFQRSFDTSEALAKFIENDYRQILSPSAPSYIAEIVKDAAATRDLGALARRLEFRYRMSNREVGPIARFFTNIAAAIRDRQSSLELGLTKSKWQWSGACALPGHAEANGKAFAIANGLRLNGTYVYPGTMITCTCSPKRKIPGFE